MIQLANLADHLEIQRLNQRYAVNLDLWKIEEWVGLFTQDAVFDESEFETPVMRGHGDIRNFANYLKSIVAHVLHHMTTHAIHDINETCASGTAFAIIEALLKDGTHARTHVLYHDRYQKVDGRWLFAERVLKKTIPPEIITARS